MLDYREWRQYQARRKRRRRVAVAVGTLLAALPVALVVAFMVADSRRQAAQQAAQAEFRERALQVQHERQSSHPPNVWARVCLDGQNYVRGRCR